MRLIFGLTCSSPVFKPDIFEYSPALFYVPGGNAVFVLTIGQRLVDTMVSAEVDEVFFVPVPNAHPTDHFAIHLDQKEIARDLSRWQLHGACFVQCSNQVFIAGFRVAQVQCQHGVV